MFKLKLETARYRILFAALFATSIALFVFSIPNRVIFIDDHWFAEQAYWLLHDGIVRSELFRSLLNYQEQQFAYHKLHIWQAAFLFYLFGFSAYALKYSGLAFLVTLLIFLLLYLKRFFTKNDYIPVFFITATILFSNAFLVEQVLNYRPETALMVFGFISFFFLHVALDHRPQRALVFVFFSAVMAGIAVLYHLNGLIFILAAVGVLLMWRRYRLTIVFIFFSILVSSIYFVDVFRAGAFDQFVYQFSNDPAIESQPLGLWQYPFNILLEFKHLFRHPKEGTYAFLFVFLVAVNWRNLKGHTTINVVWVYFLVCFLALAAISPGKRDPNYYLLIHMPYAAIIMAYALYSMRDKTRKIRVVVSALAFLYIASNYAHTIKLIQQVKPTPETNEKMVETLNIQSQQVVAGPVSLVFDQLQNLQLHATRTYFIKAKKGMAEYSVDAFFMCMAKLDVDVILLPENQKNMLELNSPEGIQYRHGFSYFGEYADVDRKYFVFKKRSDDKGSF